MAGPLRDSKGRFLPKGATPPQPASRAPGGLSGLLGRLGGLGGSSGGGVSSGEIDSFLARVQALEELEVTVGIQQDDAARSHDDSRTTLGVVAAANHYGTDTIPARPWLTRAADRHGKKWAQQLAKTESAYWRTGDRSALANDLRALGVVAVGDVKTELVELRDPPNAASTIAGKGSSNPLVDKGQLLNSHRARLEGAGFDELVG